MSFQNKTVKTLQEYINLIESIKKDAENKNNNADMLFRGQNVDEPLLPKIARIKLRGTVGRIEKLMLQELKRFKLTTYCI